MTDNRYHQAYIGNPPIVRASVLKDRPSFSTAISGDDKGPLTRKCFSPPLMAAEPFPIIPRARLSSRRETVLMPFFTSGGGKVKIVVTSEQGKEAVVAIL